MDRMLTLILNTITMVLGIIFGFRHISWSLTRKYGVLITLVDMPETLPFSLALPCLFGGWVIVDKKWYEAHRQNGRMIKFTMLHEKGHCRSWAAIPGFVASHRAKRDNFGHGKKTADYEYAADLYAAEHGAKKGGIEFLKEYYKGGRDKDCVRRIRALKRWRKA